MKAFGVLLLFYTLVFASCGTKIKNTEIKEYTVSLSSEDKTLIPLLKSLVDDFNAQAGVHALQYVESADQANSRIVVVEGLEKRDGKVGWGQWFAETERRGIHAPGGTVNKTTRYTLQAEFDADFLRTHSKIENGVLDIEAQKLFAHEIGHGFQMDHNPDRANVMYFDITGTKDFSDFWPRVQAFFAN